MYKCFAAIIHFLSSAAAQPNLRMHIYGLIGLHVPNTSRFTGSLSPSTHPSIEWTKLLRTIQCSASTEMQNDTNKFNLLLLFRSYPHTDDHQDHVRARSTLAHPLWHIEKQHELLSFLINSWFVLGFSCWIFFSSSFLFVCKNRYLFPYNFFTKQQPYFWI